MICPIEKPNLPQKRVCHAAVSKKDESLNKKLSELGIIPVYTVISETLDERISDHTDLHIFKADKKTLIIEKKQNSNLVNYLTMGYRCIELNEDVRSPYPFDCRLNALLLDQFLFYNKDATSKQITDYYKKMDVKLVPVNQGYIKCSVCPVGSSALITDDKSVCNAAEKIGIDTLFISKDSVRLNGFDYGFIGGCTGLISKDILLFNGDINYHKDCEKIIDFLKRNNVSAEIIDNKPLNDIGSIIPLTEYIDD